MVRAQIILSPSFEQIAKAAKQLCQQGLSVEQAVEQSMKDVRIELTTTEEIETHPAE